MYETYFYRIEKYNGQKTTPPPKPKEKITFSPIKRVYRHPNFYKTNQCKRISVY